MVLTWVQAELAVDDFLKGDDPRVMAEGQCHLDQYLSF
jgi:hypothetical protein